MLVVDATEGAGDQDGAIAGEAEKAGCGVIIAVNKWDLMKGRGQDFVEEVRRQAAVPVEVPGLRADPAHLGAHRRAHGEAARGVDRVAAARQRRVPTAELNKFLERVTAAHPPASKTRPRGAHSLRRADRRRAADVRALHQRRDRVALLLRAVPGEPAARVVRIRGHADPADDQAKSGASGKGKGQTGQRAKGRAKAEGQRPKVER